jgi:hypothetical protein
MPRRHGSATPFAVLMPRLATAAVQQQLNPTVEPHVNELSDVSITADSGVGDRCPGGNRGPAGVATGLANAITREDGQGQPHKGESGQPRRRHRLIENKHPAG